jgi:hypothetical protein
MFVKQLMSHSSVINAEAVSGLLLKMLVITSESLIGYSAFQSGFILTYRQEK